MKNNYIKIIVLAIFFSGFVNAQVGIGTTTPNASAAIDVFSSNKGLLIPRINLTNVLDATTIPSPATGMMIYNKTAAGADPNKVIANAVYFRSLGTWAKYSNLAEIKLLKIPADFAVVAKSAQNFSNPNLTTINSAAIGVVPILFSAGDVVIANPTDVQFVSTSVLRILSTSFYQISGSIATLVNTASPQGQVSSIVCTLQKSTDGGSTWSDVIGASLPFDLNATGKPQTLVFPDSVQEFQVNDQIRIVISRAGSGASGVSPADYVSGSGIKNRLSADVTKSFRITKLPQ